MFLHESLLRSKRAPLWHLLCHGLVRTLLQINDLAYVICRCIADPTWLGSHHNETSAVSFGGMPEARSKHHLTKVWWSRSKMQSFWLWVSLSVEFVGWGRYAAWSCQWFVWNPDEPGIREWRSRVEAQYGKAAKPIFLGVTVEFMFSGAWITAVLHNENFCGDLWLFRRHGKYLETRNTTFNHFVCFGPNSNHKAYSAKQ